MTISLTLPDGATLELVEGSTGLDAARKVGARLADAAVAVKVDDVLWDLGRPLAGGGRFSVVTADSDEGRHVLRHSAAHVLAQAVLGLFEGATFAIGPAIEDGFYYDFDIGRAFTPEDVWSASRQRMAEIVAEDQPFEREDVTKAEALVVFAGHPFKTEIIAVGRRDGGRRRRHGVAYTGIAGSSTCAGARTSRRPAGWRRSSCCAPPGPTGGATSTGPQLQRIYGTAWESRAALDEYLHRLEEARKRDHRKLGAELDYYSFPAELGSGLVLWHPKGALVRTVIEDYSRRTHMSHSYQMVASPHIARSHLWQTSRHLSFYADSMYPSHARSTTATSTCSSR